MTSHVESSVKSMIEYYHLHSDTDCLLSEYKTVDSLYQGVEGKSLVKTILYLRSFFCCAMHAGAGGSNIRCMLGQVPISDACWGRFQYPMLLSASDHTLMPF